MSNSNNTTTTQLHGGAVRVSFNDDDTRDLPTTNSLSGTQGGGRVTMRDGASTSETFAKHSVNQADVKNAALSQATGILGTARTSWGSLAGKLSPDSVVTIDGMDTSLANAERLGYVQRNADGNYVETNRGNSGQQQPPQGDQQQDQAAADESYEIHPEALEVINNLVADLPQSTYEGAIHKAISFGTDDLDYNNLAAQMNTTPDDARERAEWIHSVYLERADNAVKGLVDDPDAFYEWSATNNPAAHSQAVTEFVFGQSTAALKALAQQYARSVSPDESNLKERGFQTRTETNGTKMVRVDGVWTDIKTAVRLGMI